MITFATMPPYAGDTREAILLARCLARILERNDFPSARILVLYPEHKPLPPETCTALGNLPLDLLPYRLPEAFRAFPLAQKIFAAAEAEAQCRSELLAWLDPDTLVLRPPVEFLLPEDIQLAACPVHLQNISSPANEALDPFWEAVFAACGTPPERVFTLRTSVTNLPVRAQFNAGCLVVRRGEGLLAHWKANFSEIAGLETMNPYYAANPLYRIFVHQAVLAATLLARLSKDEIRILDKQYNFPLFLQKKFNLTPPAQPVTLRYDEYAYLESGDPALEPWQDAVAACH